jgi:Caspase domain
MSRSFALTSTAACALLALAAGFGTFDRVRAAVVVQNDQITALRGPDGGAVRALIIGIDAYRHVRPLKGAVADARDVESSLRKMGVSDLVTMIDGDVERASVMRQLDGLAQRAKAGDLVVLAIAGHGAQEPEKVKGSQPDGMDNVFLLPAFQPTPAGSQQRVLGTEFNHVIKSIEAKGARVLFVADTCHGGGMAREVDPRAEEMSFRQVSRYTLPADELKPISTPKDAFMTELDFERTVFLAAVDRKTKAPEVKIPGVNGFRGALSYAVARAFEGQADTNGDGAVTMKELFTNVRQVVYQLSDQRQNPVIVNPPAADVEKQVVFRSVKLMGTPTSSSAPSSSPMASAAPEKPVSNTPSPVGAVRIASLDGQKDKLRGLTVLEAPHEVVAPADQPDLVWDPKSGDVIVGGDVIAYRMDKNDLPSVIDRAAAVRGFKQMATKAPQQMRLTPNDKLQRNENKVAVEIGGMSKRALVLFNIAGDGTVQALYPIGSDPAVIEKATHELPVRVREPFGADQVIAITSDQRMTALEQALKQLNQRRTAVQLLKMVERYAPPDARVGTVGLFTAP